MRQLIYIEPNRLTWQDVKPPSISSDREALVRPLAVSRCDLDYYIATGVAALPGPFAFGHETYDEIVDVGDDVRGFAPGDRVIVPFQISCGSCARCRRGHTGLCSSVPYRSAFGMAPLSGVEYGGSLSDLIKVPFAQHMLVHAPRSLKAEAMAGLADNVTTAFTLVAEPLSRLPRAPVLVVGGLGSGIGLHVAQCAIALGSDKVVFVDDDEESLRLARQIGADPVAISIDLNSELNDKFPITIDASGKDAGLLLAIRATEYEGICQRTYGAFEERTLTPLRDMYARNITLKLGRVHARAHMDCALNLMYAGRLEPQAVITSTYSFSDAAEALVEPGIKMVFLHESMSSPGADGAK